MTSAADDMVADVVVLLREAVSDGHMTDLAVDFDNLRPGPATVSVRTTDAVPLTLLAHALVAKGWNKTP